MFDEEYGEENLLVSTKTEYDAEENVLRPKVMSDYVGQQKVKENLSVYIAAAKARGLCSIPTERPPSCLRVFAPAQRSPLPRV